jgi:hypothetical protein
VLRDELRSLRRREVDCYLLVLQTAADLTNAVSWLPPGILWAQKLSRSQCGALGIVASVIMLYRLWPATSKPKDS